METLQTNLLTGVSYSFTAQILTSCGNPSQVRKAVYDNTELELQANTAHFEAATRFPCAEDRLNGIFMP